MTTHGEKPSTRDPEDIFEQAIRSALARRASAVDVEPDEAGLARAGGAGRARRVRPWLAVAAAVAVIVLVTGTAVALNRDESLRVASSGRSTTSEAPTTGTSPTTGAAPTTGTSPTTAKPEGRATSSSSIPPTSSDPPAAPSSSTPSTPDTSPPTTSPHSTVRGSFALSPSSGLPGARITVSGTGCRRRTVGVWVWLNGPASWWMADVGPNDFLPTDKPTLLAAPAPDGRWSVRWNIPAGALNIQNGEYTVRAYCGRWDSTEEPGEFVYPDFLQLDVIGPRFVPPKLSLSATEAPTGTTVEVTGDRCPQDNAVIYIGYDLKSLPNLTVPVRSNGTFSGRFQVPRDAPVGYPVLVFAECGDMFYPQVGLDVIAG